MSKSKLLLAIAALALVSVLGLVTPAMADTIGPNGETLSLVFIGQSGNSYTFQLTVNTTTAGSVLDNAFLDSVALKISGSLIVAGSSVSGPAALNQSPNTQVNTSGSSIGCSGGGNGWMCGEVTVANSLPLGPNGASYTFTFVIQTTATGSSLNLTSPDVKVGYSNGTAGAHSKVGAIVSQQVPVTTPPPPVPEPASMVLFGTGLLGIGAALRRRLK